MYDKNHHGDFPRGPGVKNPACTGQDSDSIPGWGHKVPHAIRQLSLYTTTTEPELQSPEGTTTEAHVP